jgi:hypothetical protein
MVPQAYTLYSTNVKKQVAPPFPAAGYTVHVAVLNCRHTRQLVHIKANMGGTHQAAIDTLRYFVENMISGLAMTGIHATLIRHGTETLLIRPSYV